MVRLQNNNVYGVELDLNITKLKNKFKEATTISTEFSKKIEKTRHFGQNAFGDIVEIKQVNNELIKQNRLYSEQQQMLNSITKLNRNKLALSNLGTTNFTEGNNYSGYIASFKKATIEEKKEINDLNNEIEDTGKVTRQVGTEISQAFNKGLKSVKKLTLGFLGARTAFSLFRKYMSEYQSQNEVFAQKMQLTTSVIANALAPAFEFFGNVIQYVVIGLARIIELLFGVNILGKTVDNSLKGASQSAKELNENLSGLDEISNIDQSSTSGLASGLTGQLEAMEEFKKKIAEVDAFFKKFKIDKIILGIRNAFKAVWDFATEHPILTTALVAGLIALKSNILPGLINTIAGTGTGAGLSLLGAFGLLTGAVVGIGTGLIVGDFLNLEENVWNNIKAYEKEAKKWEDSAKEKTEKMKSSNKFTEEETKQTREDLEKSIDMLINARNEALKLVNTKTWLMDPAAYYDAIERANAINIKIQEMKDYQSEVTFAYELTNNKLGETGKLINSMTGEVVNFGKKALIVDDYLNGWKKYIDEATGKLNFFKKTYTTGFDKPIIIDVDVNTSQAQNKFQNFATNIKNMLSKTMGIFQTIPSYDVGTDYVPRDQLAMVHQGERIIPKQYNNSDYLGSLGNSETNDLLIELNRSVLEFAKRPSVISVNGKELAKATYNDYQEESSRRGTNISVRRV